MKVLDKVLKFFGLCRFSIYEEVVAALAIYAMYVENKIKEEKAAKENKEEKEISQEPLKKDLEPKKAKKAKSNK